ncbi:MAG: hypothetical protein V4557_05560 [Bacteroidota bacterium]
MKNILAVTLLFILLNGCATKAFLAQPVSLTGKRIAVGVIDISRDKSGTTIYNDTVCSCISQTVGETLYPYFQKMGAVILKIPYEQRTSEARIHKIADSLQVDYLISGTGLVNRTGKTDFMHQLTINLISRQTQEVFLTGSFSGPGVYPAGAANRVGKKILNQKLK